MKNMPTGAGIINIYRMAIGLDAVLRKKTAVWFTILTKLNTLEAMPNEIRSYIKREAADNGVICSEQ